MLRSMRILLLIAALLGLVGQATAMAAVPLPAHALKAAAGMSEDCMEIMSGSEEPPSLPCDGSFKCMLAMGCLTLNATAELDSALIEQRAQSVPDYWPAVAVLRGSSVEPEPHPPASFG